MNDKEYSLINFNFQGFMKNFLLIALAALLIVSCSEEQRPSDPKQILINANTAKMNVSSARFEVDFSFSAPGEEEYNGKAIVDFKRDTTENKLGFSARMEYPDDSLTTAYNGKEFYILNHANKEFVVAPKDAQPEELLVRNWISTAIDMIFSNVDITEDLTSSEDSLVYSGVEELDGEKMDRVYSEKFMQQFGVTMTDESYISHEDNLPRMIRQIQVQGTDTVMRTMKISNLDTDRTYEDDYFTLKKPDEYTAEYIEPRQDPQQQQGLQEGSPAPNFSLNDINGNTVSLESLRGNVVLLDFWGTWCKWCVKAMPKIENIHQKFAGKNVKVLGISCQEPRDADPAQFLKDNNITYNSLLLGDQVAQEYKVTGFPTLFLIDKQGNVLYKMSGYKEDMDQMLIQMIEQNL